MKKILFIAAVGLTLASCKKDWRCECTSGSLTSSDTIYNETLEDAKSKCNTSGSVLGVEYDCSVNVFK